MLLELKHIKKYFQMPKGFLSPASEPVRAVDDVDLSLNAGENLGLVGESGSGKTTLGRIILKLYQPDAGVIRLEEEDITHYSTPQMRPVRRKMQMVFQDPYSSLDPRYTVRNILKEALLWDEKMKAPDKREAHMAKTLSTVGLDKECLNRFPHEFSGGERQRIAIARALAMNPKLLILDEAVSSLDVLIQHQIIDLLIRLQKEFQLTYLFISHNLRVVKKLSRRIAVMYKGKIVELAPTEEIFNNPLHPYTKELLLAAIDYKPAQRREELVIPRNAKLIDSGNGHFVMEHS